MFKSSNNKETRRYLIALIILYWTLPCMSIDFSQEPSRLGQGQVFSIALSPDGYTLASIHNEGTGPSTEWQSWTARTILLWDLQSKTQVGALQTDLDVASVRFSPDGMTLASTHGLTSGSGTISLWDVAERVKIGVIKSPDGVEKIVFSPDGKVLASSGWSDSTVRLWDVQTQGQIGSLPAGKRGRRLIFSPDGTLLVVGGHREDEAIRIWDVQTEKQVGELIGHLDITTDFAFCPDGTLLASAGGWHDKAVYLWDFEALSLVGVLPGHSAHVGSVAYSPDGKLLASTSYWDNAVYIWDIASQEKLGTLQGHDASDVGSSDQVVISSDGRWLACASETGVELWKVNLPSPVPKACACSPRPCNGTMHHDTWVSLSWNPGDFAVSHDVYLSDNFDDVNTAAAEAFRGNQIETIFYTGFAGFPYPNGLVAGTTYYWRIDEINDLHPESPWKGEVWSFSIPPKTAYNPYPVDGAELVDLDVELSWTAGFGAKVHAVYFGDNLEEVNNATDGIQQVATNYTPGPLQPAKTYYWRVDELTGGADDETHKGDVWSFSTQEAIGNPHPLHN